VLDLLCVFMHITRQAQRTFSCIHPRLFYELNGKQQSKKGICRSRDKGSCLHIACLWIENRHCVLSMLSLCSGSFSKKHEYNANRPGKSHSCLDRGTSTRLASPSFQSLPARSAPGTASSGQHTPVWNGKGKGSCMHLHSRVPCRFLQLTKCACKQPCAAGCPHI